MTKKAPSKGAVAAPTQEDAGQAVVRGASVLIILQVLSRAFTFIANQLLLRYLTAQLLGISTQLEVYYLSVLFFARESLRVAIQRQGSRNSRSTGKKTDGDAGSSSVAAESQAVVNLGYLSIFLGLFVALGLGWMYLAYIDDTTIHTPYLIVSLRIYAIAAMLELCSEPVFVLMQARLQFATRATAESAATFLRCAATVGMAITQSTSEVGVLPFAIGQLVYGAALLVIYLGRGYQLASRDGFSLLPARLPLAKADYVWCYFDRQTISLASSMMAQSVVKHILTQGDTFLVSILSTSRDQGVYALVNNYGGLLARLVFQPIEESSRSYFSRLLSESTPPSADKDKRKSTQDATNRASQDLYKVLKLYIILSAIIVSIGPVAAPSLLTLVAGKRWSLEGAGTVLAVYCYYVPFLAVNGVAEAFVASVATEKQVHRQSLWMAAFSLVFGVSSFFFMTMLELGASGLIYANIVNMFCRIIWSLSFISSYFSSHDVSFELLALFPHPLTVAICAAAPYMVRRIAVALRPGGTVIVHLIKLAIAYLPFLVVL
jgi:oligosaccharide translocation protein RFT1